MPVLKELRHTVDWPWETVWEAVWKRHPEVPRFNERKSVDVVEKRMLDVNSKAKVSRTIIYDYSEFANNILLQQVIGNGSRFQMDEELEFDWVGRVLTIVASYKSAKEEIAYSEKSIFKVSPENNKQTIMIQTGYSQGRKEFFIYFEGRSITTVSHDNRRPMLHKVVHARFADSSSVPLQSICSSACSNSARISASRHVERRAQDQFSQGLLFSA
jgi:hypothetical protein